MYRFLIFIIHKKIIIDLLIEEKEFQFILAVTRIFTINEFKDFREKYICNLFEDNVQFDVKHSELFILYDNNEMRKTA